ncbi:hypothetical protein J2Z65_006343 [Paenibacillus aceris]|uniref:Uncharacterized protein n=1 Tax=Paenibacillus aceris TaxID=869555 RepID=A0ABS4I823_9BACL|nr:hypothetical protein [Paenibacillus aceris]
MNQELKISIDSLQILQYLGIDKQKFQTQDVKLPLHTTPMNAQPLQKQ